MLRSAAILILLIISTMGFSKEKGKIIIKSNYSDDLLVYLDTEMFKVDTKLEIDVPEGKHRLRVKRRSGELLYSNSSENFKSGDSMSMNFKHVSKTDYTLKSMLLPGLGQLSNERYLAGSTYTTLFAGAIGFFAKSYLDHQSNLDDYDDLEAKFNRSNIHYSEKVLLANRMNSLVSDSEDSRNMVILSAAAIGAVYIFNIFDAIMLSNENNLTIERSSSSFSFSPSIEYDGMKLYAGVNYNF